LLAVDLLASPQSPMLLRAPPHKTLVSAIDLLASPQLQTPPITDRETAPTHAAGSPDSPSPSAPATAAATTWGDATETPTRWRDAGVGSMVLGPTAPVPTPVPRTHGHGVIVSADDGVDGGESSLSPPPSTVGRRRRVVAEEGEVDNDGPAGRDAAAAAAAAEAEDAAVPAVPVKIGACPATSGAQRRSRLTVADADDGGSEQCGGPSSAIRPMPRSQGVPVTKSISPLPVRYSGDCYSIGGEGGESDRANGTEEGRVEDAKSEERSGGNGGKCRGADEIDAEEEDAEGTGGRGGHTAESDSEDLDEYDMDDSFVDDRAESELSSHSSGRLPREPDSGDNGDENSGDIDDRDSYSSSDREGDFDSEAPTRDVRVRIASAEGWSKDTARGHRAPVPPAVPPSLPAIRRPPPPPLHPRPVATPTQTVRPSRPPATVAAPPASGRRIQVILDDDDDDGTDEEKDKMVEGSDGRHNGSEGRNHGVGEATVESLAGALGRLAVSAIPKPGRGLGDIGLYHTFRPSILFPYHDHHPDQFAVRCTHVRHAGRTHHTPPRRHSLAAPRRRRDPHHVTHSKGCP